MMRYRQNEIQVVRRLTSHHICKVSPSSSSFSIVASREQAFAKPKIDPQATLGAWRSKESSEALEH